MTDFIMGMTAIVLGISLMGVVAYLARKNSPTEEESIESHRKAVEQAKRDSERNTSIGLPSGIAGLLWIPVAIVVVPVVCILGIFLSSFNSSDENQPNRIYPWTNH